MVTVNIHLQFDMGKSWIRTAEQTAFLEGYFPLFIEARSGKRLEPLFSQCFEGWFRQWPECDVSLPAHTQGQEYLTTEYVEILGKAIEKRKRVCRLHHFQILHNAY
jgi:hypothetical protein